MDPGRWIWTAAAVENIGIGANQITLTLSFPAGETHFLIVQGIPPVVLMEMKGVEWQAAPDYVRFASGWYYDEATRNLYIKLTHDQQNEDLVINFLK